MAAPNSGVTISTAMMKAAQAGHPKCTSNCQYRKAPIMPMAPWPKLKIPEVV